MLLKTFIHRMGSGAFRSARIESGLACLRIAPLFALFGILAACDDIRFPRDPEKTLETVLADGEMTVAFADNSPWVTAAGEGPPKGVEADLVRAFADELGVSIDWRRLGAFAALKGLEHGDIDLAIGGFVHRDVTPVAGAAPSLVFFQEVFLLGARPAAVGRDQLEGREVYVPNGLPLAELVRSEGGIPVEEWSGAVNFAAVPHWLLDTGTLRPTQIELHRARHVMAVRQGENAWLMRLERFLRREQNSIASRLRESAP